jgi:hypothetical protein
MNRKRPFLLSDDDDQPVDSLREPHHVPEVRREPIDDDDEELKLAPREVNDPPKEWTLSDEEWRQYAQRTEDEPEEEPLEPFQFSLRGIMIASTFATIFLVGAVTLDLFSLVVMSGMLSLLGLAFYTFFRRKTDTTELMVIVGFVAVMICGIMARVWMK